MNSIMRFHRLRHFLSLAIISIAPVLLCAQEEHYKIERLSTRAGLSEESVRDVIQDRYGLMWLGTREGIDVYDGYGFRSYRHDAFDTTSLSDYGVTSLAEDSAGGIWAGTMAGGLSRLDRRTGRSVRFYHDPRDPHSLSADRVSALAADRVEGVWIGTPGGLNRYSPCTGRMQRYVPGRESGLPSGIPSSLFVDRRGRVWVCTIGDITGTADRRVQHLSLYNPKRDSFITWPVAIGDGAMRVLGERNNGALEIAWKTADVVGQAMLYLFTPETGDIQRFDLPRRQAISNNDYKVIPLIIDEQGACWYTVTESRERVGVQFARSTLYREHLIGFDTAQRRARSTVQASPAQARLVMNGLPHMAFRDRSGTIWVGTQEGVVKISRIGSGFTTWQYDPEDTTTLSARRIRSVHVDQTGVLWVGTDLGLNRYDPPGSGWRHYFARSLQPGALPNSTINVIYEDRDGTLLFGTNSGLAEYDRRRDRFIDPLPRLRLGASVWSILRDRHGRLWVGTLHDGLALYDSSGNLLRQFQHDSSGRSSGNILDGGVWCLLEDSRGTIWIGTNDGLCRWMPEGEAFRSYTHRPGDRRSLGGKRIWALYEDSAGDIWTSSFGGGISRYNRGSDDFTSFTTREGLANNGVFGLLEDGRGNFWISSAHELVRWDRSANTFRFYDEGDGLHVSDFAFKAFFKAMDGTLYFGGVDGLTAFKPTELYRNPLPPPLSITGFHLFDSLVTSELFNGDTIRLDHTQNFFSFEFAALDYINPSKNSYAYILEGINPAWVYTDSDHRAASYTDLAPGTYVFHVRGSNNDGVWNHTGISITVIIAPPWYGTWWFRIAAAVTLIAIIIGAVRLRTNGLRRHEREKRASAVQAALESQETERQRIARDLHDGVGQLLAAAGINLARLHEMMRRRTAGHEDDDDDEIQTSIERAMGILGRAGEDVRSISHALGTSTLRELGLVAAVGELLANVDVQENTRFEFVAVGMEERMSEQIETGLFRVAQELIANVLHHANASEATVQIMRTPEEFRLSVEDNGAGFDITRTNGGMGRRNIAARVAAMGGRLHYDSTPGHGTTVTVVVQGREQRRED